MLGVADGRGGFKVQGLSLAVRGNADDAILEEDLCSSDNQRNLLFSEVGYKMRDTLKLMVLRLYLKNYFVIQ